MEFLWDHSVLFLQFLFYSSLRKLFNIKSRYDTLAELHYLGKQITLCKVPAHIGIKGNEEAGKATKQAIDMPG